MINFLKILTKIIMITSLILVNKLNISDKHKIFEKNVKNNLIILIL